MGPPHPCRNPKGEVNSRASGAVGRGEATRRAGCGRAGGGWMWMSMEPMRTPPCCRGRGSAGGASGTAGGLGSSMIGRGDGGNSGALRAVACRELADDASPADGTSRNWTFCRAGAIFGVRGSLARAGASSSMCGRSNCLGQCVCGVDAESDCMSAGRTRSDEGLLASKSALGCLWSASSIRIARRERRYLGANEVLEAPRSRSLMWQYAQAHRAAGPSAEGRRLAWGAASIVDTLIRDR